MTASTQARSESDVVQHRSGMLDGLCSSIAQLETWRTSPAANEIERHTLRWLAGKFGLPADATASFTSGGAEANFSAVVVALTRAFPQYGDAGLQRVVSAPAIYLTGEAHHSF